MPLIMEWSEAVSEQIATLPNNIVVDEALIRRVIGLVDLTSLNTNDTQASVAAFLEKANTSHGHVAAVCVYPQFVRLAAAQLAGSKISVASVANFPEGAAPLENVLVEIGSAIEDGANEIDVVFPYGRYLAGEQHYAHTFVEACKAVCGDKIKLKVILETGALNDPAIIADAAYEVLAAGADFIKTSTGKIAEGATLEAAATMLLVIRHIEPQLKHHVGIKISGGIRDMQTAAQYIALADKIMGREWVTPQTFRIGASKLIEGL
jgi:deoxyribose-phosphate aldolase